MLFASLNKLYSEHLKWKKLEIYADCLRVFKFQSLAFFFVIVKVFPETGILLLEQKSN